MEAPLVFLTLLSIAAVGYAIFTDEDILRFAGTRLRMPSVALRLTQDSATAHAIGNYYFNGGAYNLDLAKAAFKKALSINPSSTLAHYTLANILFVEGRFFDALTEINREIELHPEIPNSYYVRGLIYGYLPDYALAEQDFRRFTELVPSQWAGYNDLAWVEIKQEKFKEARETITRAFAAIPGIEEKNPWLWTTLGVARLNLKQYNESKEALEQALEIASRIDAKYFWGAYPGNDPRLAEGSYKQFLASIHFNLSIVYDKLGDGGAALNHRSEYQIMMDEISPR